MGDVDGQGLRERKRVATRRAILTALLELSIDRGFERVTIEDVCRAADVSPRTFFNYFESKDDALAGDGRRFEPDDEQRRWFVEHDGDVLGDLVELMAAITPAGEDLAVHRLRRELMEREPRLVVLGFRGVRRLEESVTALLSLRLGAELRRRGGEDDGALQDRARLLALVCTAVVRHGWGSWMRADGSRSLPDCLRAAYAEFGDQWSTCDAGTRRPARPAPVPVPT